MNTGSSLGINFFQSITLLVRKVKNLSLQDMLLFNTTIFQASFSDLSSLKSIQQTDKINVDYSTANQIFPKTQQTDRQLFFYLSNIVFSPNPAVVVYVVEFGLACFAVVSLS